MAALPKSFDINSLTVGSGRCLIITEVAQAHDGSLGTAHAFIDAAAEAGADAIKFQTHIAAAESTRREPWRVKFSFQDDTRYDYWQRMEFSPEQWRGLRDHAIERDLVFLSSAFSPEAVDLLAELGMPAWKVASGEIVNLPLLDRMARTGKPVILSSGMSSFAELDLAIERLRSHGVPVGVMQCTTSYPTPPEKVGLNVLAQLRERYGCPVGLSDHSATPYAGIAAVALGASMVETHLTFAHEAFGPDATSSLTPAQLAELVKGIRFVETALAHPVDKDAFAAELEPLRKTFGKSVVAKRELPKGHELTEEDLALKKPGDGLPPSRFESLVGRVLTRPVAADDLIEEQHLA
ncbi:MAG TPA: N-acetylneuraminate synthase [Polyangiaceae bacterium]|nr:N-acetylneuraminate synthase [Polyangiaceae bacterium]